MISTQSHVQHKAHIINALRVETFIYVVTESQIFLENMSNVT